MMDKKYFRNVACVCVATGWLMFMTGCETTMNQSAFADIPSLSSDLTMFVQQFAQEALAAFLF